MIQCAMKSLSLVLLLITALGACVTAAQAPDRAVTIESDGWALAGLWSPQDSSSAVLVLHQAAGDRNDFAAVAEALAERSISVLQLELRGHGASVNLGRFEPPYAENLYINEFAWRDIATGIDWLRSQPGIAKVGIIAASYSGEHAALAARNGSVVADAYLMVSPGSFSNESIDAIDLSRADWIFFRTEQESPNSLQFIDEIHTELARRAPDVDTRTLSGAGHAANMLDGRPDLPTEMADWLSQALK